MLQKALIDKLYVELFLVCEEVGCTQHFECSEEPKDPIDLWAKRAAFEADLLGWRIAQNGQLLCPKCSKDMRALSDAEYTADARKDVVNVAKCLLSQNITFLEGVRQLTNLLFEVTVDKNDSDFKIFVLLNSLTNYMPAEGARLISTKTWITKCDHELEALQSLHSEEVARSCENLINRFAH
jgi:Protein of unknown function (DUF2489)